MNTDKDKNNLAAKKRKRHKKEIPWFALVPFCG